MQIQRFIVFIFTIVFIVINCNPVFSSDDVSIMGEVYKGEGGEINAFDKELKSPQGISSAPVIKLSDDNLKAQRSAVSDDSIPHQIGFARHIESLSEKKRLKKALNWIGTQDGGYTATIIISSPEAKALRVGLIIDKLPQETEFRFFAIDDDKSLPTVALITGEQINKLQVLNKAVDPDHPDSQTYWSPTVAGESMGIEIYLPPGIHPDNFVIAIPFLSHIFVSPFVSSSESLEPQRYGDSDPCQNDATCYSSWLDERNSVAHMIFTESGFSYQCTGTLLNDTDTTTQIPYFITANHCIGNQTVASTLETHWFFESDSCNSTTLNSNDTTRYGGATLHWTKGMTTSSLDSNQDVTFLELNDTPPEGVFFSGWNSTIGSDTVTGIHHPSGDWKKISFGDQSGDYKCYNIEGSDYYTCSPSSTGSFLRVNWIDGGTEGGSSGSGLFIDDQLIGTLLGGGGGNCAGSESDYSKFGAAYSAGNLSQWLDPSPPVNGVVILTRDDLDATLPGGSDAVVYGTTLPNEVVLGSGAKAELINFPGSNNIEFQSDSDLFMVSCSGTIVTFEGSDGTVLKIPASQTVQMIDFPDRSSLAFNIHNGQVMLDDQVIGLSKVPINQAPSGNFSELAGTWTFKYTIISDSFQHYRIYDDGTIENTEYIWYEPTIGNNGYTVLGEEYQYHVYGGVGSIIDRHFFFDYSSTYDSLEGIYIQTDTYGDPYDPNETGYNMIGYRNNVQSIKQDPKDSVIEKERNEFAETKEYEDR